MKWLKYLFYFLLGLYLAACIGLYFAQDKILFYPHKLAKDYRPSYGEEVWIQVEDDVKLNAVHMKQANPRGAILYLHGNKGNVQRCARQTRQFQDLGYDILVPDYRSYGKSEGALENEAQMYADAQKMYDYLKRDYQEIVILGYSLGTGMASYLAANNKNEGLILVAPYVSLVDMKNKFLPIVPNFLLKYPFRSDLHLQKVTSPISIIHGKMDEVIPFQSSLELKKLFPKANLVALDRVGHRGVIFDATIRNVVKNL